MKRSEALTLIFNKLQTSYNDADMAEQILTDLEIAGMIPPIIEVGDSGFMRTTELLDYTELDYDIRWPEE